MADEGKTKKRRQSMFLNENVMAAACSVVVAAGLGSLYFFFQELDYFQLFQLLTKLATTVTFMMTIITVNHFFINYTAHGNVKNAILNRIALAFKLAVYIILFSTNSLHGLSSVQLWKNGLQYVIDIALLAMLVCVELQINDLSMLRNELAIRKRKERDVPSE